MPDPRATDSPSPTPPTLKTIRADLRHTRKPIVRGHNRKVPPHHVIKQPGSALPQATPRTPKARRRLTTSLLPDKKMSAGCCDAASPWMSWNWWWEPIRGYTRQRSQAEQEMIEACTTPRSGRTSFDE